MNWRELLGFKKWVKPQERYEDDVLGPLVWSADEESWAGEIHGIKFYIAYEYEATPPSDLLVYARKTLTDPGKFIDALERAKSKEKSRYPSYARDIDKLRYEEATFSRNKAHRSLEVYLGEDEHCRHWFAYFEDNDFADFQDHECRGLRFDT